MTFVTRQNPPTRACGTHGVTADVTPCELPNFKSDKMVVNQHEKHAIHQLLYFQIDVGQRGDELSHTNSTARAPHSPDLKPEAGRLTHLVTVKILKGKHSCHGQPRSGCQPCCLSPSRRFHASDLAFSLPRSQNSLWLTGRFGKPRPCRSGEYDISTDAPLILLPSRIYAATLHEMSIPRSRNGARCLLSTTIPSLSRETGSNKHVNFHRI